MTKKKLTKNHSIAEEKRDSDRTNYNWSKMADLLKKSTCRSIERWYMSVGIPKQTFYDAVNREPCMKEAHEFALERIGCDREDYCWEQKLSNNSVIGSSLPQFLDRYKHDVEWRSKLKEKEENRTQVFKIEKTCNHIDEDKN